MQTFHSFKDDAHFEKFMQSGKYPDCHKGVGCLDYVKIGRLVYTMHEYDMDGKYITWANKKHEYMIEMTTSDRYRNGYSDAVVISYAPSYLRSDINYAQ